MITHMKQSHCWTNAGWRCCWYVYRVCLEQDWISHIEAADAADVLLIAAGSGYVITGLSWQLNGSHSDTQRWDTECKKWNEGLDFKIKPKCLWSYHGKRVLFGCSRWDQNPVSESRMLQEIRPFIFACPFKLESVIIIVCQGGPMSSPGPAAILLAKGSFLFLVEYHCQWYSYLLAFSVTFNFIVLYLLNAEELKMRFVLLYYNSLIWVSCCTAAAMNIKTCVPFPFSKLKIKF